MLVTILALALGLAPQDWYVYEPESKAFRVELPSKPNQTSSRTVTRAVGRSQVTSALLRTSRAIYSVGVTENRGKVDPRTLDEAIRQFAAARNGVLGPITPISVGGHPGREFTVTEQSNAGPKVSKQRWVASGQSLYVLMVAGKPGGNVPADADRFLGSLEIGPAKLAVAARVPSTTAGSGPAPAPARRADVAIEDPEAAEPDESKPAPAAPAKTTARKTAPVRVTFSRIPKSAKPYPSEDLEDLSRSFSRDRDGFRDVGPSGSVLVGVRVTYIEKFGGPKVRSLQPIYRSGKNHYLGRVYGDVVGPIFTFVARPGYAVGGLVTHTGLTLDGFGMVFMKVDGDRLETEDQYNSPWIGDPQGGSPGEVNARTGLVVGVQGRASKEVNALGLTALK